MAHRNHPSPRADASKYNLRACLNCESHYRRVENKGIVERSEFMSRYNVVFAIFKLHHRSVILCKMCSDAHFAKTSWYFNGIIMFLFHLRSSTSSWFPLKPFAFLTNSIGRHHFVLFPDITCVCKHSTGRSTRARDYFLRLICLQTLHHLSIASLPAPRAGLKWTTPFVPSSININYSPLSMLQAGVPRQTQCRCLSRHSRHVREIVCIGLVRQRWKHVLSDHVDYLCCKHDPTVLTPTSLCVLVCICVCGQTFRMLCNFICMCFSSYKTLKFVWKFFSSLIHMVSITISTPQTLK